MTASPEMFTASPLQQHRVALVCALRHDPDCMTSVFLPQLTAELDKLTTHAQIKRVRLQLWQTGPVCFTCTAAWWAVTSFLNPCEGYLQAARENYLRCCHDEAAQQFIQAHPDLDTWTQADFEAAMKGPRAEAEARWDSLPGSPPAGLHHLGQLHERV